MSVTEAMVVGTLIGSAIGAIAWFGFVSWYWKRRLHRMRRTITAHHALGALDGVLLGDKCPVCEREQSA